MRIPEVLHDLTPRYVYPIDETHLVLRLKSRRKSVQKVTVIYGDRYQPDTEDDRRSMRKMGHDSQYDYWQCVLEFPKRRARYQFLLETDTAHFWYGEIGVEHTRDDAGYFYYPYLHRGEALKAPDWAVGSIVYQIFPDRFAKGDPTLDPPKVADWEKDFPTPHNVFGGDLQGVINHLDDLQALGVDVLYFTPIFLSPSNHKYDTTDYYRIDPHFGDEQTLKKLVEEAHRRGIRVILDAVFNHSGYDFFAFRDVREKGNRSPYRDWFFLESEEQSIAIPKELSKELPKKLSKTESKDESKDESKTESKDESKTESKDVSLEANKEVSTATFVEASSKGHALVSSKDGADEVGRYETFANDVWSMPKLNTAHPEVVRYLIGVGRYWIERADIDGWRLDVANEVTPAFWRAFREEVKALKHEALIIGEIWHDALPWLGGDMFDGVMNYMFREAMVDFFAKQSIGAATFAERLVNIWMRYPEPVAHTMFNLLDSHDTERFITTAGGDEMLLRQALFVTLTYPGMPMLYYGTEVALEGKTDPDCRRPYPWKRRDEKQALINEIRTLAHLRKTHTPLRRGGFSVLYADEAEDFLVYARPYHGSDELYVVLASKSRRPVCWPIHVPELLAQLETSGDWSTSRQADRVNWTVSVLFGSDAVQAWDGKNLERLLNREGCLSIPPYERAIITFTL